MPVSVYEGTLLLKEKPPLASASKPALSEQAMATLKKVGKVVAKATLFIAVTGASATAGFFLGSLAGGPAGAIAGAIIGGIAGATLYQFLSKPLCRLEYQPGELNHLAEAVEREASYYS